MAARNGAVVSTTDVCHRITAAPACLATSASATRFHAGSAHVFSETTTAYSGTAKAAAAVASKRTTGLIGNFISHTIPTDQTRAADSSPATPSGKHSES
jgi:hypothetical protein